MTVARRLLHGAIRAARQRKGMCALAAAALFLSAAPAGAQGFPNEAPPPHLSAVEGDSRLDREDETVPADPGMPLVSGDRLRTGHGRAAVQFPDGSLLAVDAFTTIEFQSSSLLRLTVGRVHLTVSRASTAQFQIDTPAASARPAGAGAFSVVVLSGGADAQSELAVTRGEADLIADRGSVLLRAGERSVAWANSAPSRPATFNSARFDAFEQWADMQGDDRSTSRSRQYLPSELRVYGGALDRDGAWQYESSYGYVWYPVVDAGWRPYSSGYWAAVPQYGWTWIGAERWAWPTHHYGRWGHSGARWFWIPDRQWSPAWVSWGAAPGYVSWCPLGFDNRPLFELSVSAAGWGGWMVLPRERFGRRGESVLAYVVSPRSLPARTPFVEQSAPPLAPARSPSRRGVGVPPREVAVPRGPERQANADRAGARAEREQGQTGASATRAPRRLEPPPGPSTAPPAAHEATPRRYPFGDFRRDNPPGAEPPPVHESPGAGQVGPPRERTVERARERAVPPSPRTEPAPPQHIYVPPPASAGAPAPRPDEGHAVERPSRFGAGAAPSAGSESSGGSGGGTQGSTRTSGRQERAAPEAQPAPRGDGRAHAPDSRRPR